MKKLIFWGTIFALFVLGGGGAGAYIHHTNAVQHENTTNTSGSGKGQNPKSGPADNNGKNKKTSVTLGMQQIILLRNKFAVR